MCLKTKRVYLFGAGGSVHANGPLNKDWIERIKKNNENINNEQAAIDFLNNLPGFDNLEALLSLIDLSIIEQHNYLPISASLDYLKNIREKIIDCIVNVAREINTNDRLVNDFFEKTKLQDGDTVINFNYDLLVDCGLYKTNLWNPYLGVRSNECGYGFGITSLTGNAEQDALENIANSKINYLKLHGSINWLESNRLANINWNLFDPARISQTNIVYSYPPNNFIITPSFVKMFKEMPLRMMWRRAHESILEASEIYIIGYSFPKADVLARQLLLYVTPTKINKITVIDPLGDSCSESAKREDIISMLPWESDSNFWATKIEIISKTLEQYTQG